MIVVWCHFKHSCSVFFFSFIRLRIKGYQLLLQIASSNIYCWRKSLSLSEIQFHPRPALDFFFLLFSGIASVSAYIYLRKGLSTI